MGQSIAYCLSSVEGMLGRVEVENRESGIIAVENVKNMERAWLRYCSSLFGENLHVLPVLHG